MDVSSNRYFSPIPTGEHRFAAHFSLQYPTHLDWLVKFMEKRTAETPLQFSAAFFRRPARDKHGNWTGKWIEHCTVTDATGSRIVNEYYPKRQQIHIPYLHYRLNTRQLMPLMKVSFRPAFADAPDSPVVTHVERLWDVLDYETALRGNMLTDDAEEAEPDVYAIIEHTTGIIIPIAVGMKAEFIVGQDDMMTIRVLPMASRSGYRSYNGHERYEDEGTYSEQELRDDIARWSRELGEQIAKRDTEEFANWREAIKELKERTQEYDRDNQ
ncbi:hypothetical protein DSM100688_1886 [Bifidobacterium ramosum]|uniref:Uncharacterized protein n=1 Tax=Bifidobacterium ramosum TaxID=1798158 RepID=A0A6L4WYG2_9BIFI|nr:hypothetical protein [Bifidobacterium ramosum]KAB8287111.1 hypothetical protein DSM100688_1886 [Bifidobacterium ramosum]NEG71826.1 hypothetical protein [Bifidobacterium ramosum]